MKRLAILSTHPIQYNAPLFRRMAEQADWNVHVFFSRTSKQVSYDPDFQREVVWDTPLTEGYAHSYVDATAPSGKKALKQSIEAFQPDALLVYGWNFPGHLHVMRKLHGKIPIWFRGDSHLIDPMPFWKRRLRKCFLTWVYRHVDHCFPVGSNNSDYFRWCGVNPSRLSTAYHAIDHTWFEMDNPSRIDLTQSWRHQLGIPHSAKIILFAGKLEPKKAPKLLIQAWQKLSDLDTHLIIAGSGILKDSLEQEFKSFSRLHFVGFQNQSTMPILYHMADVFCLPSSGPGETWGLAVNEALSCGTPCVVSDKVGCARDMLTSTSLGTIFDSNNLESLCEVLRSQLQTPPPNAELLATHRAQFSFDAFTQQITKQWNAICL